ncbi:MAG: transcriptional regulator [Acidobacteria bacterium]|nr:MAG: transcriptional regulator [Acidobacteriota bacterium]
MFAQKLKVNLRRYRFEAGDMTQQDLAERVGVTRQTIISIEKGKYEPSIRLALRLARLFRASVEDIFQLDDRKEEGNGDGRS